MARTGNLSYTTKNNLRQYINIKKAQKMQEKGGIKVLLKDVEEDLARHCELTRDSIVMIKRGINQPSLAVALKIAEYFGTDVNKIFKLKGTD